MHPESRQRYGEDAPKLVRNAYCARYIDHMQRGCSLPNGIVVNLSNEMRTAISFADIRLEEGGAPSSRNGEEAEGNVGNG